MTATHPPAAQPVLPPPRGPVSGLVLECLSRPAAEGGPLPPVRDACDPFGEDLQLALTLCYELHYRGFSGVDADWEWHPGLLRLRAELERRVLDELLRGVGPLDRNVSVSDELRRLSVEPASGNGVSHRLRDRGTWSQMREYLVHRSIYHLKEGDPHAWLIPRIGGQAKASFVAVEFDEFGAGHGRRVHQQLFADLLAAAGLDNRYLGYLDAVPAATMLAVNTMSLFGLHRRLRGAAVGQFAAIEITSSPGSRRMVEAMRRMGAPSACEVFYSEHIEADAVHEQVVRRAILGPLLREEPELGEDVVFGVRAWELTENLLDAHLQGCWDRDESSLGRPLD